MSHSLAPRELPRIRETAAGPAGSWLCSSLDILGNVELFESKGNKSFANVNTNDCGKGLVLKERLRILRAYRVIFWQGLVLGCHGNDEDKIIVIFLMVVCTVSSSTALGWKNLRLNHLTALVSCFLFLLYLSLQTYFSKSVCELVVPYFLWAWRNHYFWSILLIICLPCHRFKLEEVHPADLKFCTLFWRDGERNCTNVGQRPTGLCWVSSLTHLTLSLQSG